MTDTTNPWVQKAIDAANNAGIPSNALAAFLGIIQDESGFNPNAPNNINRNGTYDSGIAQLNSAYYPGADTMTPEQQLATAAATFATNYNTTGGDLQATVGKYNPGAGQSYINKVLGYASDFAKQLAGVAAGPGGDTVIGGVTLPITGGASATGVQPIDTTAKTFWQWVQSNTIVVAAVAAGSLVIAFSLYGAIEGELK